jgi:primosomal protein N' (replication factor Y)
VPNACPLCAGPYLEQAGFGTERVEAELKALCPAARVGRLDRDSIRRKGALNELLSKFAAGEIDILVGTQMIAKGHDFPRVTLVGVISADVGLGLADFRAAERTFQLLTQVAGRAGRGELPGRVLVQTHHMDHYAIRCAAEHNYLGFVGQELRYRRLLHYPPAAMLTNILIEHTDPTKASQWASQLGTWFQHQTFPGVRVLGPAAAPIGRIKRIHRFHLILKASSRKQLAAAVRQMLSFADAAEIPRRHLTVDVDAVQLM